MDRESLTYPPELDTRTNDEIVESIHAGNKEDIGVLWVKNQGLVRWVIHMAIHPPEQDVDDLIQQAFFGFLDSVNRYDPQGRASFFSWVSKGIEWSLKRYYLHGGYACYIPPNMKTSIRKYERVRQRLTTDGIEATDENVMYDMGIDWIDLQGIKKAIRFKSITSLDIQTTEEGKETIKDFLLSPEDVAGEATDNVYYRDLHKTMTAALGRIRDIDRQMIIARYYLGYSLDRIAETYGCTKQAIDQHIKYGFQAIRHGHYSKILKEFL